MKFPTRRNDDRMKKVNYPMMSWRDEEINVLEKQTYIIMKRRRGLGETVTLANTYMVLISYSSFTEEQVTLGSTVDVPLKSVFYIEL